MLREGATKLLCFLVMSEITLAQSERGGRQTVSLEEMVSRARSLFHCTSVVVAEERHKDSGLHHHIASLVDPCWNKASTKGEPWRNGKACNLAFHKAWGSLRAYVVSQRRPKYVWGQFSQEQILLEAEAVANHRKGGFSLSSMILRRERTKRVYKNCDNFLYIRSDPEMANLLLTKYNTVKKPMARLQASRISLERLLY